MKKLIYFIICIFLLSSVSAYPFGMLDRMAKQLESNDEYTTVMNIDRWVEDSIEYKFYLRPRGMLRTLHDMEGDCSDKAVITDYMLRHLGYECRLVHGYANIFTLHDWYEVKIDGEWYAPDVLYFKSLRKRGSGLWG